MRPHVTGVKTKAGEVKSPAQGHPDRKGGALFPAGLTPDVGLQGPFRGQWLPEPGASFLEVVLAPGSGIRDESALRNSAPRTPPEPRPAKVTSVRVPVTIFSGTSLKGEGQCFPKVSALGDSPEPTLKADSQAWSGALESVFTQEPQVNPLQPISRPMMNSLQSPQVPCLPPKVY